ncbi:hypothetical protein V8V91_18000 [Algoriphagus halophilus]
MKKLIATLLMSSLGSVIFAQSQEALDLEKAIQIGLEKIWI